MNDWVHRHPTWETFKHTCGAIDPLLPSLIRAGFDIINPVQCSAAGVRDYAMLGWVSILPGITVVVGWTLPAAPPASAMINVAAGMILPSTGALPWRVSRSGTSPRRPKS